jgi:hypothetical protein
MIGIILLIGIVKKNASGSAPSSAARVVIRIGRTCWESFTRA